MNTCFNDILLICYLCTTRPYVFRSQKTPATPQTKPVKVGHCWGVNRRADGLYRVCARFIAWWPRWMNFRLKIINHVFICLERINTQSGVAFYAETEYDVCFEDDMKTIATKRKNSWFLPFSAEVQLRLELSSHGELCWRWKCAGVCFHVCWTRWCYLFFLKMTAMPPSHRIKLAHFSPL